MFILVCIEVFEEYRHPDIMSTSGYPLELDFFYPQINIAVEYQGEQHYKYVSAFGANVLSQQRDEQKSELCKEKGGICKENG